MGGVNKLVEDKKMRYIKGSTALAPEKQQSGPVRKEDYEVLKKSKIERENRLKHKKNLNKRKVIKAISFVFAAGIALMFNEGRLYEKQQKVSQINREITDISKQNEDIRIQLVKLNSLSSIKNTADNTLNMVMPKREEVIYVDFSRSNFAEVPQDDKESLAEDFFAKIKNLLF
jgi:cell division protein FtsL